MAIRLRLDLLISFTLVLVALKTFEVVDWGWGWVLAPLWLPLAVIAGLAVAGFLFAATLLARLKKSFGLPRNPGNEEIVINDGDQPVNPEVPSPRRIGKVYDHQ